MPRIYSKNTQKFLGCTTLGDIAEFFEITEAKLRAHLYGLNTRRYFDKTIPKRNGAGLRELKVPNGMIKKMQQRLIPVFEELGYFSHVCHGFRKNRSIVSAARIHQGSTEILTMDIKEFFPSIHFGRIQGMFTKAPFGFSLVVSGHLANLVCFEKSLPQGAPTSPILANMVAYGLDKDLHQLCKVRGVNYTRYADDLSFSVKRGKIPDDFVTTEGKPTPMIEALFTKHGFELNPDKTRLKTSRQRQSVTGLVVNRKVNVDRRYIDRIRGALHSCEAHGPTLAAEKYEAQYRKFASRKGEPSEDLFRNLKGRISFVGSVRGREDKIYLKLLHRLFKLRPDLISQRERRLLSKFLNIRDVVKASVFVLENFPADQKLTMEELGQGTAFYVHGVGFITCDHCIKDYIELVCPNTQTRYQIANIRSYGHPHDLAIFDVPGFVPDSLLFISEKAVEIDETVKSVGFSDFRTPLYTTERKSSDTIRSPFGAKDWSMIFRPMIYVGFLLTVWALMRKLIGSSSSNVFEARFNSLSKKIWSKETRRRF